VTEFDLSDTIYDSLATQTNQALVHFDNDQTELAACIVNEWTVDSGECVLTHYILDTTTEIEDELFYFSTTNNEIGLGTFSFDPEAELPVDNN
jgi:hypothetical protein